MPFGRGNLLSALAKRIARVSAEGSPSEKSAATFQTHERSEPTLGERVMSVVTRVRAEQLLETH